MKFKGRFTIDKKNNRLYTTILENDENMLGHGDYIAFCERKFDLLSCQEIQKFTVKSGCDLYHNLFWSLDKEDNMQLSMLKHEVFFYDNVERKEFLTPHDRHLQCDRIFTQYDLPIQLLSIFLLCIDDRTFRRMEEYIESEKLQKTTKTVFKIYMDVQKYICNLWGDEHDRKNAKALEFFTWAKEKGFILPDIIGEWIAGGQTTPPSEQEETPTIPQEIEQQYIDAAKAETKGRKKHLLALLDAAKGKSNKAIKVRYWETAENDNQVSTYVRQGYELAQDLNLPSLDDYLNKTSRTFKK